LFESFDGQLQIVFDRAGYIANRVGGQIHVADVRIDSIGGQWVVVLIRSRSGNVELRLGGTVVAEWQAPEREYEGLRMMPGVDGDLREPIVYSQGVNDADADRLETYLSQGRSRRYVQFRRGDVARFRTRDD
jgi:hypothetical protein